MTNTTDLTATIVKLQTELEAEHAKTTGLTAELNIAKDKIRSLRHKLEAATKCAYDDKDFVIFWLKERYLFCMYGPTRAHRAFFNSISSKYDNDSIKYVVKRRHKLDSALFKSQTTYMKRFPSLRQHISPYVYNGKVVKMYKPDSSFSTRTLVNFIRNRVNHDFLNGMNLHIDQQEIFPEILCTCPNCEEETRECLE